MKEIIININEDLETTQTITVNITDVGAPGPKGEPGARGDTILNTKDNSDLKVWIGSKEEYEKLENKDENILYLIKENKQ